MTSDQPPKNRKERRAAERQGKPTTKVQTVDDIALELPNRKRPDGKTLFDLADERQAELDKNNPNVKRVPARDKDDDPLGPGGDAVLYGSSLSMLHFTLDVLVYQQYRQDILWKEICARTAVALPILMFLVYMLHPKPSNRLLAMGKQIAFMITSVIAGCYLIFSGNKHGYYAVMKRAPPLGTLWVWSVIEMDLTYAVASLVVVGGYMKWSGFTMF
jgi:hypothetical protein